LNELNKEQILFLLTLAVLGAMTYFSMDDRYHSVSFRGTPKALELEELPPWSEIQFADADAEFFSREGRNIFAPPRDWLPLDPLIMDAPQDLDLAAVGPMTRPGPGECAFDIYHWLPGRSSVLEGEPENPVAGEGELPVDEDALEEEEEDDTGSSGLIEFDFEGEEIEEDPEAALMACYDWIRINGQMGRIFGYILNDDKYSLTDLQNRDSVRFELVSTDSGKSMGVHDYTRDLIQEFGFADTVVNRIELAIRKINFNAGNLATIHEKALWCLSLSEEDKKAVEYAEQLVKKAVELDPLSKESYCLLADIYKQAFDTENRLKILRSAIDRRLKAPGVYVRYGRLLRQYDMNDAALGAYLEAEHIEPRYAEALACRAELAYDSGDYARALDLYGEAWRSPSWRSEMKMKVLLGEGRCLLALNRLDECANKTSRAVNLDEENGDAWSLKGGLALAKGEIEDSEEAFRRAEELMPDLSDPVSNLGIALFRKMDREGALKKFEEAAAMDPYNSCRPTAAAGFLYECLGEDEQASTAYKNAVTIDPRDFYAIYLLGRDLRKRGDLEAAIPMLKKALQLNGGMREILGELGHSCLLSGLYEDSSFYFEEYLDRGTSGYRLFYLLGLALMNQGRVDDAVERFGEAIEISDKNPSPFNGLAYALYTNGDVDESLEAFGRVLRLFDENSSDPRYEYAKQWMSRIEEHRRKSQWFDTFQRNEIGNEWNQYQRCGPTIKLVNNQLVVYGNQRQDQPYERTALRRSVEGREFRVFEADLTAGGENQARMGIFVGLYISRGVQGDLTKAEVGLALEPNGSIVYNLVDRNKTLVDWERVERERVAPGETVRLKIEVMDYEQGYIRLALDGESVLDDDLVVGSLKKCSRPVLLGIFGSAPGSRTVHMIADNVRVVKRY